MLMFTLPEELLLLAINDEKGKVHPSAAVGLRRGLAGAVIAEFAFLDYIYLDGEKNLRLSQNINNRSPIKELLNIISRESRRKSLDYWLDAYCYHNKIVRKFLLVSLIDRSAVEKNKKKINLTAYDKVDPHVGNATAKYWIKRTLRSVVLAGETATPRAILMLGILNCVGLLDLVFTKDERKSAVRLVNELVGKNLPAMDQGLVFGPLITAMENQK
jgi:hypothetical protein